MPSGIYKREKWMKTGKYKHSPEHIKKNIKNLRPGWNKGVKMSDAFNRMRSKIQKALWAKPDYRANAIKKHTGKTGSLASNWRGGVTTKNHLIRNSTKYKLWRADIFERDNYTCRECGQRGGRLEADHIKPFALFPELRFELTNGRTLCKPCHLKTDTWGGRKRKKNLL